MAPKRSQQEEAVAAGERNVVPGQSWLAALIRGIGREMQENSMGGAPFGQATREELGSLGYEQMLREQYPEEFARGRLYGSEAFPTDVASLYAARPGRSAFTQIAGREAGAAGGPRALGGAGTPALNYEPIAAAPKGSFDANMMEAFRRGAAGSRAPGRPQAFRPEDFLAIEQGPLPTSRNAFEANAVMAQRRGMPSPAPAAYDYEGPAGPGPFIDRPRSRFDENAMAAYYRNQGKGEYGPYVPGRRTGTFQEGDFPPYTPEEMGQAVAPYRPQTMVEGGGIPPGGLPARQGGQVPSYRYVGSEADRFPRGEYQAPYGAYGEFRDVTGNVLRGPAGSDRLGYSPMARELPPEMTAEYRAPVARGGIPYGKIAAGALGAAGVGLPYMAAYYEPEGRQAEANLPPAGRGRQELPPIDVYGHPLRGERMAQASMEAPKGTKAPAPKATKATKAQGSKGKATPTPAKRPSEVSPEEFEGNLNYYVTQMLDRLTGQDEAERGRKTQQYYEKYGYGG